MATRASRAEGATVHVVLLVTTEARRGQADLPFDDVPVAGTAVQSDMGAIEAIVGLNVVIEPPEGPAIRVMAQLAVGTQTAFVSVFGLVAAPAFQGRVSVLGRQVACLAGRRGMQPDQREARKVMIEKDFCAPVRLVMAAFATRPLLASVHVVLLVAGGTRRSQLFLLWVRSPVAGPACEFPMPLPQGEPGVLVVIEGGTFPFGRAMTGGAFRAKGSLMHVVLAMAGLAGRRQLFLVHVAAMAVLTFQFRMPVPEREARVLVVVEGNPFPVAWRMAALALRSVAALVPIVGLVAGDTSRSEILFVKRPGMASGARDLDVPADKRELGLGVVIEGDVLPFPWGMAGLAFLAVSPAMYVVQPVAVDALCRRRLVARVGMTALADHVPMAAHQRILGFAVVEAGLAPGLVRVAFGAVFTQTTAMRILFSVTGDTFGGRLPVLPVGHMTASAPDP